MSEGSGSATKQSIVVDYDLAQSPAKVWRALTEPELVAAWLMPNDLRAEVGHRFTFRAQPMPGGDQPSEDRRGEFRRPHEDEVERGHGRREIDAFGKPSPTGR